MTAGPATDLVDLRSDTLTKPTPAMRRAMAEAEVGDLQYGEDPTINALEEEVAERFGRDASLFVPSGMMANSIWMGILAGPGREVVVEADAHLVAYEEGAAAANTGTQFRTVVGERGILSADQVREAIRPDHFPYTRTSGVSVEHTTNRGGGHCYDLDDLREIRTAADDHGLFVHMDGARIFNAIVATGVPAHDWAAEVDGLSFCLSKALGAPVGSMVVGDADAIAEADTWRRRLGGAMRQAGILAAAGRYALANHVDRLAEDHANAQLIAELVADAAPDAADPGNVPTNIVYLHTGSRPAAEIADAVREDGILLGVMGGHLLRLVTHLDVDEAGCRRAGEALARLLGGDGPPRQS